MPHPTSRDGASTWRVSERLEGAFRPGDTVRVHVRITEGDKERIQVFEGVIIRRRGSGSDATFTVRKISYGVGVERIFPVESPSVAKIEIKSRGHVRRSRLYYLRGLRGKKARLRSKVRDLSALVAVGDDPGTADEAVVEDADADVEASAPEEAASGEAPESSAEGAAEGATAEETPAVVAEATDEDKPTS